MSIQTGEILAIEYSIDRKGDFYLHYINDLSAYFDVKNRFEECKGQGRYYRYD